MEGPDPPSLAAPVVVGVLEPAAPPVLDPVAAAGMCVAAAGAGAADPSVALLKGSPVVATGACPVEETVEASWSAVDVPATSESRVPALRSLALAGRSWTLAAVDGPAWMTGGVDGPTSTDDVVVDAAARSGVDAVGEEIASRSSPTW
ncbi:MAG: hypothetical protein ACYDHN_16260 [Solirubrobacteraceae bacterium]